MKKAIVLVILAMGIILPLHVKADSLTIGLSCPTVANPGATVTCTISAKGNNLENIQGRYKFTNTTYKEFKLASGWDLSQTFSNTGFLLARTNSTSNNVTVGTLSVVMPSTGTAKIDLTNLYGGYAYKDGSGSVITGGLDLATPSPSATIRVKSSVNTLESLTISGATINFDKNTTTYNVTIDATSTTISATKTDEHSSISGTGTKQLKYGKNTFNIVVTSETGAKRTYVINITRPDKRSTNNNLSSLKVNVGTISFNKNTTTYNLNVNSNVTKAKVEATLEDSKATFTNKFGPREVSLNYGKNAIQIKIKAENGSEKVYTINITRKDNRSSNSDLSDITISSGNITFDKNQTEYKVVVDNDVEDFTISAKQADSKAKIEYVKSNKLSVGENAITIKVTAENGTVKTYKLIVTRKEKGQELDTNNYLSEIVIDGYEIDFNKDVLSYSLKIKDEDKLNITTKTENEKATVTVVGNENLKNGSTVKIIVTSESGETKEYTISIEKEKDEADTGDVNTTESEEKKSGPILYIALGALAIIVILIIVILPKKKKKSEN